jgi:hypothetical protein
MKIRLFKKLSLIVSFVLLLMTSLQLQAQQELQDRRVIMMTPLEAAREAGLGVEINETQTIGLVTVTAHWAYADTRGVVVFYTIDDALLSKAERKALRSLRLTDRNNNVSELLHVGTFTGGAGYTRNGTTVTSLKGVQFILPHDELISDTIRELDLSFEVNADGNPIPDQTDAATSATVAPESTQEVSQNVFQFDFTLPVYPAVAQRVNETLTIDGLSVMLKSVSITPISTQLEMCGTFPNENFWEMRNPRLDVDGTAPMSQLLYPRTLFNHCSVLEISVFAGVNPQQMHYEFDALVEFPLRDASFDWVSVKPALAEYGVSLMLDEQGRFAGSRAENMNDLPDALVELGYAERIEGPWTFEVDLADASAEVSD